MGATQATRGDNKAAAPENVTGIDFYGVTRSQTPRRRREGAEGRKEGMEGAVLGYARSGPCAVVGLPLERL